MAAFSFDAGDRLPDDKMRALFGPGQIDLPIRHAIQMCWMGLPAEKRNSAEVEQQIRRLVDRALEDFREDDSAFGLS